MDDQHNYSAALNGQSAVNVEHSFVASTAVRRRDRVYYL